MIKLIIADDHKLIRDGLKAILTDRQEEVQVVGEAASGNELIAMLAHIPAEMVLMDIQMPEMDGLQATQYIKEHFPHIQVLVLSMMEQERYVAEAIKAGALGYILKTTDAEELFHAIQTVARGEQYISTQIAMKLLNNLKAPQAGKVSAAALDPSNAISKREREVLQLIARGYTNQQIADMTFTSKRTVESHRQSLLEKTGSKNTASLIVFASKHHLLDEGKEASAGS
jgi:DNA-binding NarL/FixJ family response regulator